MTARERHARELATLDDPRLAAEAPLDEAVLARAVEGGAFDDVFAWANDEENLSGDRKVDDERYWTWLSERASEILGRAVSGEQVEALGIRDPFWDAVHRRRSELMP